LNRARAERSPLTTAAWFSAASIDIVFSPDRGRIDVVSVDTAKKAPATSTTADQEAVQ